MSRRDQPGRPVWVDDETVSFASLEAVLEGEVREGEEDAGEIEELQALWSDLADLREAPERGDELTRLLLRIIEVQRSAGDVARVGGDSEPTETKGARPTSTQWTRVLPYAAVLVVGLALGLLSSRFEGPPETVVLPDDMTTLTARPVADDLQSSLAIAMVDGSTTSSRLTAVGAVHEVESPTRLVVAALVEAATQDPSVGVRLAAIDALDRFLSSRAMDRRAESSTRGRFAAAAFAARAAFRRCRCSRSSTRRAVSRPNRSRGRSTCCCLAPGWSMRCGNGRPR